MFKTIAEFYIDELSNWNETIVFINEEMDGFEKKLTDTIRRNSIVGIADMVEKHQLEFNEVSDKFYRFQIELEQQLNTLKKNNILLENKNIDNGIKKKQSELRNKMKDIEKEYIDLKFNCNAFLSSTLNHNINSTH